MSSATFGSDAVAACAAELVAGGSLEMSPSHIDDAAAIAAVLPTGTPVFVTHLPGRPLTAQLPTLRAVRAAGLEPVPHVAARRVLSRAELAAFLRQAKAELALQNVEVYEGPVERWRPRERFDCVITRAFAALAEFVSACRHLVAPGGVLAAMKGTWPETTPVATLPHDVRCADVRRLHVPLLDAERHLILCRFDEAAA